MVGRSEDMFDPVPPEEVAELSAGEGCCIVGHDHFWQAQRCE